MTTTHITELKHRGIKAVIFDVDGTLYDQRIMHACMFVSMIAHYAIRPWRIKELLVVYQFRKIRESLAGRSDIDVHTQQYALVARAMHMPEREVVSIIDYWMDMRPLAFIRYCAYQPVLRYIHDLEKANIKVIYFSDLPPARKLERLELSSAHSFDASSDLINELKPSRKGVEIILKEFSLRRDEVIYIGDSDSKDGVAAQRCNVLYLPVQSITGRLLDQKLVRYIIVGTSSALLDLLSLFVLHQAFGLSSVASVAINQPLVIVYIYLMHKHWSFRAHKASLAEFFRFLALVAFNYTVAIIAMYLLNSRLLINYQIVRVATIAVQTIWNFFLYKQVVYRI